MLLMKYVYPALFTPVENGEYDVRFPDLPGCRTCGKTLAEAIEMAEDAVCVWLWDAENENETIPSPSISLEAVKPQFVNLIAADTTIYRRQHETKAVKKTLSIPSWLNVQAEQANAPYSQILQEGLKQYLGLQ